MDHKIIVERGTELHSLARKYFAKANEVRFRKSSRAKRDEEANKLAIRAHDIIKHSYAKEFGWNDWIFGHCKCSIADMQSGNVTIYVQKAPKQ